MQIYSNPYIFNKIKPDSFQYKQNDINIKHYGCDTVSFHGKGVTGDQLIRKINELIECEVPKNNNYNLLALNAKKKLLELILHGTGKWPGLKARIEENLSYNLKNLAKDLGVISDDNLGEKQLKKWNNFLDIKNHNIGKFLYTGQIVQPILEKLGINSKDNTELYNILVAPFRNNSLIRSINTTLNIESDNCREYYNEIFDLKKIVLEYLLEGTKSKDGSVIWPGIKTKIEKNLDYDFKVLANDLEIPDEQIKSFEHFLTPYDHTKGKLSYTEELVMPILKKIGLEDQLYLRDFNPSTKHK